MALPPDVAQRPAFFRGLADLVEVGLADIDGNRMAHLTTEGFSYQLGNLSPLMGTNGPSAGIPVSALGYNMSSSRPPNLSYLVTSGVMGKLKEGENWVWRADR
jgi:hypothetical protein